MWDVGFYVFVDRILPEGRYFGAVCRWFLAFVVFDLRRCVIPYFFDE